MRDNRKPRARGWARGVGALAAAGCMAAAAGVGQAGAAAPASDQSIYTAVATFSRPPDVGHVIEPESVVTTDLAAHHYLEQEFFASGTAHAFRATSAPTDGRWTVAPTTAATYTTRILVRRPADPARFSGTVVVEWMNVTAGESAPDWMYLTPALMDEGDAWVGVSAQALGVQGGQPLLGGSIAGTAGLVQQEPQRYGSLHHPGDDYSLDIFDQIGLALHSDHTGVLGPLRPRHVVAVGESQSAFYLTTFADALEPVSHAFDGIFIHSRGGGGAPLGNGSLSAAYGGTGLRIRTDVREPVFMFETQTDLIELGYASAQQPDTTRIRTWEVAGTSHVDSYFIGPASSVLHCTAPVNSGPMHVVIQAAFTDFVRWAVSGTPPPSPQPFRLKSTKPAALALDAHGNVIGGVRTPAVDVPISTLTGNAQPGASVICGLFGSTLAFSPQTLASLYGTKSKYLSEYTADLDRAIAGGYLLQSERASLLAAAQQVQIPGA